MNKSELIEAMAQEADISKAAAAKALDGMVNAITEALKKGDTVTLVGFGSFYVGERAERQGRNPKTGEPLTIAAAKTPPSVLFLNLFQPLMHGCCTSNLNQRAFYCLYH